MVLGGAAILIGKTGAARRGVLGPTARVQVALGPTIAARAREVPGQRGRAKKVLGQTVPRGTAARVREGSASMTAARGQVVLVPMIGGPGRADRIAAAAGGLIFGETIAGAGLRGALSIGRMWSLCRGGGCACSLSRSRWKRSRGR